MPGSGSPGSHGGGAPVEQPVDPVGQLAGVGRFGGDVVGGAGLFVEVGDDGAHQLGGGAAAAAAGHVHTGSLFGVFVHAFPGDPLIQVSLVGFAAAGHRHVQQRPAGVFAEWLSMLI